MDRLTLNEKIAQVRGILIDALDQFDRDPRRVRPYLAQAERILGEVLDVTPVRPPSRTDMRAARDNADAFSAEKVREILEAGKKGSGEPGGGSG